MAEPLAVDYYFDCACRWAWWTSVWLRRVAGAGRVTITWRLLSLAVQDHPEDYSQLVRPDHARHIKDFELLRALALARKLAGKDGLDRLYVAYGNAMHGAKQDLWDPAVQARCLAAAELPASLFADALADPSIEAGVVAESREALARGALGTPTLALSGTDQTMFGPIIGEVPGGDEALRLWEHVRYALETPTFYELKRGRGAVPAAQFSD